MQATILGLVSLVLQIVTVLFFLIALGSDHWAQRSSPTVYGGLWNYHDPIVGEYKIDASCKYSITLGTTTKTFDFVSNCDAFNAVRAFTFMAMVLGGVAILVSLFRLFHSKASEGVRIAAIVLLSCSAICGLIAMAVFVDKTKPEAAFNNLDYDYSFALLVVGWALQIITTVLFAIGTSSPS